MKLTRLFDGDTGATVICEGHVSKLDFANRVDTDDVAEILGDDCEIKGSYPTKATVRRLAREVRHSWGIWRTEGKQRWWQEVYKNEAGAAPFTVVDQG